MQERRGNYVPTDAVQYALPEYLMKNKDTMHINRKPGEQMEVDWAGQTACLTDIDTGEAIEAYVFVAVLP